MIKLDRAYDSHIHWEGTGARERSTKMHGDWLIKFLPDNINPEPTRQSLDLESHRGPIMYMRHDYHAAWVNTAALKVAGLFKKHESSDLEGGKMALEKDGFPTGYLVDRAVDLVRKFIPPISEKEIYQNLLKGCEIFNRAGYTHVRDMTCSEVQWNQKIKLYENKELTLAVEQYFNLEGFGSSQDLNLTQAIQLTQLAKKEAPDLLRVKGIKLFYDGALGSEGALISGPYRGCGHNHGFRLYSPEILQEMVREIFNAKLEVAIHVIGDQAAFEVVEVLWNIRQSGLNGIAHLEHAQMLRPDTILKLKELKHTCHMQPCHWLSDKAWTDEKLKDLTQYLFRWRQLEELGIPFYFGSDSPIEPTSILRNLEAVEDAALHGIQKTKLNPLTYMTHSDPGFAANSYCEIKDGQNVRTVFQGKTVFG